jgi:hypothetical protein
MCACIHRKSNVGLSVEEIDVGAVASVKASIALLSIRERESDGSWLPLRFAVFRLVLVLRSLQSETTLSPFVLRRGRQ